MTNEMMRPCTLPTHWKKKEPIDACEVSGVQSYYEVGSKDKYHITINFWNGDTIKSPQIKEVKHYDYKNAQSELNHIQILIADALNAPVLATEEVLAGLPKDANAVLIDDIGIPHSLDWVSRAVIGDGWAWGDDYDVMPYHKIQAFRCHKTAEYFRQFTLDGVRRVG